VVLAVEMRAGFEVVAFDGGSLVRARLDSETMCWMVRSSTPVITSVIVGLTPSWDARITTSRISSGTWSTWSPMVLRFYTTCKRKRVSKLHHSIHSPDGTKNGLGPENACVEALDTKRGAGGGMVAKI